MIARHQGNENDRIETTRSQDDRRVTPSNVIKHTMHDLLYDVVLEEKFKKTTFLGASLDLRDERAF